MTLLRLPCRGRLTRYRNNNLSSTARPIVAANRCTKRCIIRFCSPAIRFGYVWSLSSARLACSLVPVTRMAGMQSGPCHPHGWHAVWSLSPAWLACSLVPVNRMAGMQSGPCHPHGWHAVWSLSPAWLACSLVPVTRMAGMQSGPCHPHGWHAVWSLSPAWLACSLVPVTRMAGMQSAVRSKEGQPEEQQGSCPEATVYCHYVLVFADAAKGAWYRGISETTRLSIASSNNIILHLQVTPHPPLPPSTHPIILHLQVTPHPLLSGRHRLHLLPLAKWPG